MVIVVRLNLLMIVGIFLASLPLAFEGEVGRFYLLDQDDVNEEEDEWK